jgi:hypothetical protein
MFSLSLSKYLFVIDLGFGYKSSSAWPLLYITRSYIPAISTGCHEQWCAPSGPDRDTVYFAQSTAPPTGHGMFPRLLLTCEFDLIDLPVSVYVDRAKVRDFGRFILVFT